MAAKFSFLRRVATGLSAVAVVAVGANALAANVTWKGGQTTASRNWATSTNWSPTGVPANGDSVFIGPLGTGSQYKINVAANTNEVALLDFSSTSTGGWEFTGAGSVVLNGAIVNNNLNLSTAGTGQASVVLKNVTLTGNSTLSGTGAPTEIYSVLEGAGKTLTVTGNNLMLQGTTVNANLVASTGSTVSLDASPSFVDLTIGPGGTLGGLPGRAAGTFFGSTGTGNVTFQNASTTNVAVAGTSPTAGVAGADYDQIQTYSNIAFGGTLNVDWSQVGGNTFTSWQAFDLFDGATTSGNFGSVNLTNASGVYSSLSFTQVGSEWKTGTFTGAGGQTQWLVFQSSTGSLVVVPEPSTIVFAGIGVAMSGWSVLKKRRLAKLAAKK